jgi:long-chain-fatty-acid--[acyl-carrier-protein] ligase
VGGEMISLGAVEEGVAKVLHVKSGDGPSIAVIADEKTADKSQLILFTTTLVEKEAVNKALHSAGFSRLVKISAVKHVNEIPVMGAGKIDYRKLQEMI